MYSFKDTPLARFFSGIVFPVSILVIVLINLIYFKVVFPGGRNQPPVYFTDAPRVFATIFVKFGFAYLFYTWNYLANFDKYESIINLHLTVASVIILLGAISFLTASFL